jgi:hypothetical protein
VSDQRTPPSPTGTNYQALADWAQTDLDLHPDRPDTLTGPAAADTGRALLDGALGGPDFATYRAPHSPSTSSTTSTTSTTTNPKSV